MMPTETDASYRPLFPLVPRTSTRQIRSRPSRFARLRFTRLIALVFLALAPPLQLAASERATAPDALPFVPQNLHASPSLLQLMSRMARVSPTFRAQCERVAGMRNLVVRIRYAGLRNDRPYNARTVVRRHQWGAVIAEVDLYVPIDPVEILAHELEHLVEQIQGQDLRALSQVKGSGVVEVRGGEFETLRAIKAGRRVLAECGSADRASTTLDGATGGM